jgi:hypothetical protein
MAKMQIKRIGVLSFAKVYAVITAGILLVIGVPAMLIFLIVGAAAASQTGGDGIAGLGMGLFGAIFFFIFIIIGYSVAGFVIGALTALIYNVAAGFAGGVELDMENTETGYSLPPPPPTANWGATQYQPGQHQAPY